MKRLIFLSIYLHSVNVKCKGNNHGNKIVVNKTLIPLYNFLNVSIILHQNSVLETDIFYKETNLHDYLDYFSHYPEHTKQKMSHNLAKRIMIFVSDKTKMNERLSELKTWLLSCSYHLAVIEKVFLTLNCRDVRLKKKR